MRLLNVNNYHYRRGGSDVVYLDHAAMFEAMGHDVAYFAMCHPKNEPTHWSRHFVNEIEFGHEYGLGERVVMATKVVYSLEARRKISALIEEFKPDIAHLHCVYHHLSPSVVDALRAARVPAVMTAHDLKLACPAYKMLNQTGICERCRDGSVLNVVKHRCIRNSLAASAIVAVESGLQRWLQTYRRGLDAIVVPSQFFLEKFVAWGWPRERFVHIPNYVDSESLQPEFSPGSTFVYFGRLAPEKGLTTLIKASAHANQRLWLIGTGPEDHVLRQLVETLKAPVEFLGYRTGTELHALIRQARAVVLPSEWYENAPMSVLEAMALGKPVIGARIGGIPEMVVEDCTGWLFQSGDVSQLSATLSRVSAMSDAAVASFGRRARAHVQERFSRDGYKRAMVGLYERLGVSSAPLNSKPAAV